MTLKARSLSPRFHEEAHRPLSPLLRRRPPPLLFGKRTGFHARWDKSPGYTAPEHGSQYLQAYAASLKVQRSPLRRDRLDRHCQGHWLHQSARPGRKVRWLRRHSSRRAIRFRGVQSHSSRQNPGRRIGCISRCSHHCEFARGRHHRNHRPPQAQEHIHTHQSKLFFLAGNALLLPGCSCLEGELPTLRLCSVKLVLGESPILEAGSLKLIAQKQRVQ